MHQTSKAARVLRAFCWAIATALLIATAPVSAQTADQIEAFRNLTPEQQQAILEAMGGSGIEPQGGVRRDRNLPTTDVPRARDPYATDPSFDPMQPLPSATDLVSRDPRIRPGDSVLIDLAIEMPTPLRNVEVPQAPATGERTPQGERESQKPLRLDRVTEARTPVELERLAEIRERILRGNPYRLDEQGLLTIPGVRPALLAGLTEEQATERLNLDPALRDFEIALRLLPVQKLEAEALRPFGYDLFATSPSTFAPVTDIPVPAHHVVGPGDRLEVQLIGNTRGRHSLVVNRDGNVLFPELGPIQVSGQRFDAVRERIESRVNEQMIGTRAVVTMGDLRSIRVFVLGEALRPGAYTVSSLATVTNALYASGGVKPIGSLRNIQLKRSGRVVQRVDLYAMLLDGDTSDNVRLQPDDVIFIPPVGAQVSVTGEIRRPAIYELAGPTSVAEAIRLAGGLLPQADPRLVRIERVADGSDRTVLDVDYNNVLARETAVKGGDLLVAPPARPVYANAVQLKGHVWRPGARQFRTGLRLSDVVPSLDELQPNADLHYVLIRRERPESRRVETVSADLAAALRARGTEADPLLFPRDQVFVFDLETGREQYLEPILAELKLQAVSAEPSRLVRVSGLVRAEGEYPLDPGMRVSDLVRAGGGLAEQAYGGEAELVRYEVRDGQTRRAEVINIDIDRAIAGDEAADFALRPFDTLVIKEISEWAQTDTVRLEGEVRFPGEYPIARGETLRSVIARAGGLTSLAFPRGSVFTRETLKERERQQLKVLTDRLRQDLSTLALQGAQASGPAAMQASETLAIGQQLLGDLQTTEPVGRLVIDLDRVMAAQPGSPSDVILRGGDRLKIPRQMQEVTVIGEVQNSTSHLYTPGLMRDDYIRNSGGTTQKADERRIYVVRANGSVEAGRGSRWFESANRQIQPGDTVVVPLDADRMRPLALWTAITTILYNTAISVAAVNSF